METTESPDIQRMVVQLEKEAENLFSRGKHVGAIRKLNQAVTLLPSCGRLYFTRGMYKLIHKQRSEASKDFTQAIARKYGAEAYAQRGFCYLYQTNFSKAESDFSKAIESGSEVPGLVYYGRAIARSSQRFSASMIAADLNAAIIRFDSEKKLELLEECKTKLQELNFKSSEEPRSVDQDALSNLNAAVRGGLLPNYFFFRLKHTININLDYRKWSLSDNHLVCVFSSGVTFYPLDSLNSHFTLEMQSCNTLVLNNFSVMAGDLKARVSPGDQMVILFQEQEAVLEVWSMGSRKVIQTVQIDYDSDDFIRGIAWHPSGNCFCVVTGKKLLLFRVNPWAEIASIPLVKSIFFLYKVSFSGDGRQLFLISDDRLAIQAYDLNDLDSPRTMSINIKSSLGFSTFQGTPILINVGVHQAQVFNLTKGKSVFGWNATFGHLVAISPVLPVVALIEDDELLLLDVKQKGVIKALGKLSSTWLAKQELRFASNGMALALYSNSRLLIYG